MSDNQDNSQENLPLKRNSESIIDNNNEDNELKKIKENNNENEINENRENNEDNDEEENNEEDEESNMNTDTTTNLSKKQLKKLNKKLLWQKIKEEKKLKLKELKKNKKLLTNSSTSSTNNTDATTTTIPSNDSTNKHNENPINRKLIRLQKFHNEASQNFSIIIDCDWEKEHNQQSLTSLTQQIMFSYGTIRKSFGIYLTLCNIKKNSETDKKLTKLNYNNWFGLTVNENDYITMNDKFYITENERIEEEKLEKEREEYIKQQLELKKNENKEGEGEVEVNEISDLPPVINRRQLIYLTADGEETLTSLDPHHAYIIGGIVDRNRLKNITYQKAKSQGLRTARLPLSEYVDLHGHTPVLTVNIVVEILMKWQETKCWKTSFESCLPKRKEVLKEHEKNDDKNKEEEEIKVEDKNEEDKNEE